MPEQNKLSVKINGYEYTLTSEESREYMLGVADLVDKKMQQISKMNPGLNNSMTAVLTALNLADDYIRLNRSNENLTKTIVTYTEKIKSLEEKLGTAQSPKPNRNR